MTDIDVAAELDRARAGDREALSRLLELTQERLRRITDRRLGPALRARLRASDILQSTFLDVVRGVPTFNGMSEDSFVAWVTQILENTIRRKGRFFNARKRRPLANAEAAKDGASPVLRSVATPSMELSRSEDLILVSRALDAIPEDYRRVIMLRVVDGRPHRDVAAMLGRTETATRMLLSRARAALSLEIERLEHRAPPA